MGKDKICYGDALWWDAGRNSSCISKMIMSYFETSFELKPRTADLHIQGRLAQQHIYRLYSQSKIIPATHDDGFDLCYGIRWICFDCEIPPMVSMHKYDLQFDIHGGRWVELFAYFELWTWINVHGTCNSVEWTQRRDRYYLLPCRRYSCCRWGVTQ